MAWLIGIARRELANHRRAGQRRLAATARLIEHLAASEPTPAAQADDRVHRALAGLRRDDREIVTLTYWEGLTATQIAAAPDLAPATVRKRLQRARNRLAAELGAADAGGRDEDQRPAGGLHRPVNATGT